MKFAADGMVGRLARWLRLAGFDTVYINSARPSDIVGLARREDRFILTRSTYLEEHEPDRVFRIKSAQVWEQLKEVVQHFHLKIDESLLLTRCSICNCPLEKRLKEEVKDNVPPYVFQTQAEFYSCPACRRIYWSGTHWEHIRGTLSPSVKGCQAKLDGVVKWNDLPFNPNLKDKAKELRKAGNFSEVLFWKQVKNKQFFGLDFDRQKIIGNFIVDFYCKGLGFVVEIDGSSHDEKEEYDKQRDDYLKSFGLKVFHIQDKEIRTNLAGVMEWLEEEIKNTPSSGDDTPLREGKG